MAKQSPALSTAAELQLHMLHQAKTQTKLQKSKLTKLRLAPVNVEHYCDVARAHINYSLTTNEADYHLRAHHDLAASRLTPHPRLNSYQHGA